MGKWAFPVPSHRGGASSAVRAAAGGARAGVMAAIRALQLFTRLPAGALPQLAAARRAGSRKAGRGSSAPWDTGTRLAIVVARTQADAEKMTLPFMSGTPA